MNRPRTNRLFREATAEQILSTEEVLRLYTVCVFDEGLLVPWVRLVDARDDCEAIALARAIHPSKRREIWDRHRLVAEFREVPLRS